MPDETVGSLLRSINLEPKELAAFDSVADEFKHIKKAYFRKALATHPDKGGEPDEFRRVNSAFEVLRSLYERGAVRRFRDAARRSAQDEYAGSYEEHAGAMPSWDYYFKAAEEPLPVYRVELARTGRSSCNAKGAARQCPGGDPRIEQGDVRCGWYQKETGTYGRWAHLRCWRVPAKIWLGLPGEGADEGAFESALAEENKVTFSGYDELPPKARRRFLEHVMDREHWARYVRFRPRGSKALLLKELGQEWEGGEGGREEGGEEGEEGEEEEGGEEEEEGEGGAEAEKGGEAGGGGGGRQVARQRPQRFVVPKPGAGGCRPDALEGKTIVLTGTFPEVGGSSGLREGKDRVKAIVESFGGKVTSAVSGRTDLLVVGDEPGFSKVAKARASEGRTALITLHDLKGALEGRLSLEEAAAKPLCVGSFSQGFRGTGLAAVASPQALKAAAGRDAPPEELIARSQKGGTPARTGRLSLPDPGRAARAAKAAQPAPKRGTKQPRRLAGKAAGKQEADGEKGDEPSADESSTEPEARSASSPAKRARKQG